MRETPPRNPARSRAPSCRGALWSWLERPAVAPAPRRRGLLTWQNSSHHLDVGLDGAGRFDGLQDRDQVARPEPERIQAVNQLLQRDALADHRELLAVLLDADPRARHDLRPALGERCRLAYLRRLRDGDREVALRDR